MDHQSSAIRVACTSDWQVPLCAFARKSACETHRSLAPFRIAARSPTPYNSLTLQPCRRPQAPVSGAEAAWYVEITSLLAFPTRRKKARMRNWPRIRREVVGRCLIAISVVLAPYTVYTAVVTPVVTFAPPAYPESIAFDKVGNAYIALFPTGEIRKIAPDGTPSTLAVLGAGSTTFPG